MCCGEHLGYKELVCESTSCECCCGYDQRKFLVGRSECLSLRLLPVVAGDVVDPEGVAHIFLAFVLVFTEAGQHVDLVEFRVDGGSLGEARHRHCMHKRSKQTVKDKHIYFSCRSDLAKSGQDFMLIIAKLLSPQNERQRQR